MEPKVCLLRSSVQEFYVKTYGQFLLKGRCLLKEITRGHSFLGIFLVCVSLDNIASYVDALSPSQGAFR